MLGTWLEKQLVSQAEYVNRLGKLVLLAAQHESNVFVGRGVQFMLPRDRGLAVRIIAPTAHRLQSIMERRQCGENEAKKYLNETDSGRAQFIRRYFHRDVADPHEYDLVINMEYVTRDAAIELIVNETKQLAQRASVETSGRKSAERQFRRLNQPYRKKREADPAL